MVFKVLWILGPLTVSMEQNLLKQLKYMNRPTQGLRNQLHEENKLQQRTKGSSFLKNKKKQNKLYNFYLVVNTSIANHLLFFQEHEP